MWSTAQRWKKIYHLILMLSLNETIPTNSVHWYGDVLRRKDGHVLSRALDFEVEGQRKKGRLMSTFEKQF